ncbi:hypothetical protein BGW36DRAFT_430869 [Talaromyces proteolyticus]|uniref:Uncharacterized protein n=1 Tax=Talaromyces proteolyticus TaxID=1131652 RepID=A0AAD4KID5_9EURO|nr:uncharacterized protein BGW36DRAFT_430869 [Talaromyces proteolyticus]KAH8693127.1 hypothetical protein BGW36DRAFT_430869 [Talaromyces proteolyticus]
MEHVSTLCAVSTVGIAATGFALARREPRPWPDNLTLPKDTTWGSVSGTGTIDSNRFPAPAELDVPIHELREGNESIAEARSNWTLPQRRRERRRRQTYTTTPLKPSSETATQDSVANSRPSSSWLRRISVISSSHTGSSLPSPTTTASSSLNGPASITHSRIESASKHPNKLVKRSTSQHSIIPQGERARRPMSASLALRRPATSHQRSADIAHRVSFNRETGVPVAPGSSGNPWPAPSDMINFEENKKWKPYFPKANRRRNHSTGSTIVTIKPNNPSYLDYPTLLLCSSINSPQQTRTSVNKNFSRPGNVTMNDPLPRRSSDLKSQSNKSPSREKRKPIRSYSFSSVAGNSPGSRSNSVKHVVKSPEATTRLRSKDRVFSNPLPRTLDGMATEKSESPRLRRKRNFTGSDTFPRPQTAPQGERFNLKSTHSHEIPSEIYALQDPFFTSSERSPLNETAALDNKPVSFFPGGRGPSPPIIRFSRIKRLSGAASDRASTVIGSDDTRIFTSADEDDQSDSVFDSFRTRISSSSQSGRRGPNIETIFRDSPTAEAKKSNSTDVEDLALGSLHLSSFTPRSSISDLNSMSTPLASTCMKDGDTTPTPPTTFTSHPTIHSSSLKSPNAHIYEVDSTFEGENHNVPLSPHNLFDFAGDEDVGDCNSPSNLLDDIQKSYHASGIVTPSLRRMGSGIGTRASVFDWSEQTRNDRDIQDSNHRPSTVHGKQGTVGRGSRGTGRKAPNAVHLRSQSVPVSRDGPPSSENRQPSLKFGTWGLGQKGVSEDWDGDFDFGDSDEGSTYGGDITSDGRDHYVMKVPQAIMESQASVHGQYGHVQELTLLVEELKRLRIQGNMLRIIQGPSSELWKEAEGIVNLATLEDDENSFPAPVSPSSCGSFDCFESSPPQKGVKRRDSEIRRPALATWPNPGSNSSSPGHKDPSEKVKSVLETIYQQRESADQQTAETPSPSLQKLPFDTQSLKDLVNRAGVVTRALKDVIRRAEGVATSSESIPPSDPPFSRIFSHAA